eukprot:1160921-Pelagomonas_calceolata.AAC.10
MSSSFSNSPNSVCAPLQWAHDLTEQGMCPTSHPSCPIRPHFQTFLLCSSMLAIHLDSLTHVFGRAVCVTLASNPPHQVLPIFHPVWSDAFTFQTRLFLIAMTLVLAALGPCCCTCQAARVQGLQGGADFSCRLGGPGRQQSQGQAPPGRCQKGCPSCLLKGETLSRLQ